MLDKKYNFKEEAKIGDIICDIVSRVRGEKSNNNLSLKTIVNKLDISCTKEIEDSINKSIKDFKAALFIDKLNIKSMDRGYEITDIDLDFNKN